jgi:hypothetical protein
MDIPHQKKDKPDKLVTQLRLYRALYDNWNGRENYQDPTGETQEDPGVPLADLARIAHLSHRPIFVTWPPIIPPSPSRSPRTPRWR